MNIAIYARVASTKKHEYHSSIEAQLVEIRNYAKNNQHHVTGEYIDAGYGSYSRLAPRLIELINDIMFSKVKIDAIIVRDHSRLTRNIMHLMMIEELLVKKRIKLISVREYNIHNPHLESILKRKSR